jgi:hypothetical protein
LGPSSFVQNPLRFSAVRVALLLLASVRVSVVVLFPSRFSLLCPPASEIGSHFRNGRDKIPDPIIPFNSRGVPKASRIEETVRIPIRGKRFNTRSTP